jgi:hypothetical protein
MTTQTEDASKRRRALIRTLFVSVLTTLVLIVAMPDVVIPWHPLSVYGFSCDLDGVIHNVVPGFAAADAGIVEGDTVDFATTGIAARSVITNRDSYVASLEPGNPLTFLIRHNGVERAVTLDARQQRRSLADNVTDIVLMASELFFALIGSALVLMRPSGMTWAFYVYSISNGLYSIVAYTAMPIALRAADMLFHAGLFAAGVVAFVIFALRFPNDRATGWAKYATAPLVVFAVIFGLGNMYPQAAALLLGLRTEGILRVVAWIYGFLFLAGIAAVVRSYVTSGAEDRQRVKWVVFGLIVGFGLGYVVLIFDPNPTVAVGNLIFSASVLFPIALAYAIVRHRVIDVNFIVSRTLVYGAITALIIGLFGVMDWFFSTYLSLSKAGTAADIIVAIAIGIWFKALHGRVDAIVDALFFRRRHEAENRLRRLAKALPHASSMEAVVDALVGRAADALDLSSAAIFFKEDPNRFVRARAIGWGTEGSHELSADDVLVLQLTAEQQPLALSRVDFDRAVMPRGQAQPSLAVPIAVRNELRAVVLYGPHRRGDDLDPDEISVLTALASSASAALDHAEAVRMREESDALAKEVESMRVELAALRADPVT